MKMQKINFEQFQKDFDRFIDEVENGKSFIITGQNSDVMIIPYFKNEKFKDDLVRLHTDHNEAS